MQTRNFLVRHESFFTIRASYLLHWYPRADGNVAGTLKICRSVEV